MLVQIILLTVLHGRNHYLAFTDKEAEVSVTLRINFFIVPVFQLFPSLIGLLSPTTEVFLPVAIESDHWPKETSILRTHSPKGSGAL